jgi:hypothetical protein
MIEASTAARYAKLAVVEKGFRQSLERRLAFQRQR